MSAVLASERSLNTKPANKKPVSREYYVSISSNSTNEVPISRDVDMTYCPVWNDDISFHDIVFWIILVFIPVIFGPILTCTIELICYLKKKCSKAPYPDTPSKIRQWIIVFLLAVIVLGTYSTHLWLAEKYMKIYFDWNYFNCLLVKYFFGSIDIMLIPLVVVLVDKQLGQGLAFMFYAKKRGILSKATSESTSL